MRDQQIGALKLDVETLNGRVVLSGRVPDAATQARAIQIARAVDGVAEVESHLTVGAS